MNYAEVAVNSPIARPRAFTYSIPEGLTVAPGHAVLVPFGEKTLQGIVLALSDVSPVETRDIAAVLGEQPVISSPHLELAKWISQYYLSPIFDAVALMLPPGFEQKAITFVRRTDKATDGLPISDEQAKLLETVGAEKLGLKALEKAFGKKKAQTTVSQLVKLGLLARSYELEPPRVKTRTVPALRLLVAPEAARREAAGLRQKRSGKQAALLDFLSQQSGLVSVAEARQKTRCSKANIDALVATGLIALEVIEVRRGEPAAQGIIPSTALKLTSAQEAARSAISEALRGNTKKRVFLLHGVTGSGKTEVYLQALAEAVRLGKRGIVLVPEIAMTPQTVERFAARFRGRVAVLHSQLSPGEQFDEWHRIRRGEFDVVIGPRSAIFAPQPDLGLIVLDEEHEWTYKQVDKAPRYHGRAAALKLAELTGATTILGSATPDVETYYRARQGEYQLLQLLERVTPNQGAPLPAVEVVDMRDELKAGNLGIFSRSLEAATTRAVSNSEQVILFLNRRGAATAILCRNCGLALRCRRCETILTYHSAGNTLVCHHCNYRSALPRVCPRCSRSQLKFLGVGTEKLEEEARNAFANARQIRWDSDVTGRKNAHTDILHSFRNHEADILIGTQMVAKGLDLPSVTLVGVVSADTSLNLPDFRGGERTFQLLSQVAGRAGRGPRGGQVIIQTFSPEHYALRAAAKHDYAAFYEKEIEYRRRLRNPPFSQLALLVYSHTNNAVCQREAEKLRDRLVTEKDTRGISDLSLIGPAPAFVNRLRGRYRWQLVLRGSGLSGFLSALDLPNGWTVDIDPVSTV